MPPAASSSNWRWSGSTARNEADRVRVVEFETPAAILCGTPSEAIPLTYHSAYFDLTGTGFGSEIKGMRLLVRLVGSPAHLRGFTSLVLALTDANKKRREIKVQLDHSAEGFIKALDLRMEGAKVASVLQLRSDGEVRPAPNDVSGDDFAMPTEIDANSGFSCASRRRAAPASSGPTYPCCMSRSHFRVLSNSTGCLAGRAEMSRRSR